MLRRVVFLTFLAMWPTFSLAGGWGLTSAGTSFERVGDRDRFVEIVSKRSLKRLGITLIVLPDGRIDGRAFGRKVSGRWQWQEGYFCRDLYWGTQEIGANCQEVRVAGELVRFTSDQGNGRYADLRID